MVIKRLSKLSKNLLSAFVELYRRAYEEAPTYAYQNRKRIKSYLQWLIHRDLGEFLVAFKDQKPVGFLVFEEIVPVPEIHEIAVLPEFKGQHVGEKLMAEALNYLAEKGYSKVALWVGENNLRAQRFYERLGFVKTERVGIWIRMEKDLQRKDLTSSQRTSKADSTSEREIVSSGV